MYRRNTEPYILVNDFPTHSSFITDNQHTVEPNNACEFVCGEWEQANEANLLHPMRHAGPFFLISSRGSPLYLHLLLSTADTEQ